MVCLSFARGVGLCYLVGSHVGLYVGSGYGLSLDALSVGLVYLVGCLWAHARFLYRADAPFPMFIGEVLSGFCFI